MRLLFVIIVGALLYFLQNYIFKKYWAKELKVDIEFDKDVVREGDKNTLIEFVSNDKFLPLPVLQVKFSITRTFIFPKESNSTVTDLYYRNEYFSLNPYSKTTRKYNFLASKRGVYQISSIDIIAKDLFIDRSMFANSDKHAYVTVLPGIIRPEEIPEEVFSLTGDIVKRVKYNEDPFEFNSIREYEPFDPVNHINWKATAKNDYLQVNTFNTTQKKSIVILLNLDTNLVRRKTDLSEGAIKIASCLSDMFLSHRVPVAMFTNGIDCSSEELIGMEAGCDEGHARSIDIALARIKLMDNYSSFTDLMNEKIEKGENEYVIISNYRKDDLYNKYIELLNDKVRICMIVPEFKSVSIEDKKGLVKWTIDDEN